VFVNVAIPSGSGGIFTYSVPKNMTLPVSLGKRVLVPFGSRRLTGYIVEVLDQAPRENLRDILDILDSEPLFEEKDLSFYIWASRYYLRPLGKALGGMLPPGIDVKSQRWVTVVPKETASREDLLTDEQQTLLALLRTFPRGRAIRSLKRVMKGSSLDRNLNDLAGLGCITIEDRLSVPRTSKKIETILRPVTDPPQNVKLTDRQRSIMNLVQERRDCSLSFLATRFGRAADTVRALEKKGLLVREERETWRIPDPPPLYCSSSKEIILNDDQEAALGSITGAMDGGSYVPFLLHGVTGSGKTEIYLRAIAKALESGGSALLMVPEIGLTGQLLNRVRERFDSGLLAVFHSGLSDGERYDQWRLVRRGDARILLGTRSAVFVPMKNLRLIVVDEEHDTSYKQDDRMPYNARDLAIVRAGMSSAVVVLGSATPDIQTYHNTLHKGFRYLELPRRVENRSLPEIQIVDMREPDVRRGKDLLISKPLLKALEDTLSAGKQSMLLLNRRGFATFLFCLDCGHVFTCRNCSVTMTHHMNLNRLKCHYCDYAVKAPPLCPNCRGTRIHSFGAGTEKLYQEVASLVPQARIARLDSDIASGRGVYERVLSALDRREIDILIGTQMIAKGHDFPHVTLVGVVSADSSLNIPDFRAAERTFQLLVQVSGRGGRGESPGLVLIQTLNPGNAALVRARSHDYRGFYDDELATRRDLRFPPFSRLVNLRVVSKREERAAELAGALAASARTRIDALGGKGGLSLLGPAEPLHSRIRGIYRRHLLLKGTDGTMLRDLALALLEEAGRAASDIKCDVDPLNFM
jgi:primosomal protein N' (replication factor Y)